MNANPPDLAAAAADESSNVWRELRFIAGLLWPYRGSWLGGQCLLLLQSALLLTMPWFAGRTVQALLEAQVSGELLLYWFAALAAQAGLGMAAAMVSGAIGARLISSLGQRIYRHLQSLPLKWHQRHPRGSVLALLSNDLWQISRFQAGALTPLLPLLFSCGGAAVLLLRIEPQLGAAIALGIPVFALVAGFLTRELRPLAAEYMREDTEKYALAEHNLAVLPLIKAYTREHGESARYAEQAETVRRLEARQANIDALVAPVVRLLSIAAVFLLLWLGKDSIAEGRIAAPDMVALLLYGLLLTQPVSQLAGIWGQTQHTRGAVRRLMAAMASVAEPDEGKRELRDVRGEISYENLRFAYPNRPPVYDNLNWAIHPGETVAITGANGAGKSTLAHLLLRFADPSAGRITLDGVDIRELRLANLRGHIGLVSQHVLLLNATVAENIGYGRLGATREDIERAARAAHAHDFIEKLPQGYDTVIGDEGLRLSGGQRQRVSLARALLKDPAILILDEATAMFDPEGERGFIAECHALLKERTVLLITHRPASLALADRVFRLENGQMREVETAAVP